MEARLLDKMFVEWETHFFKPLFNMIVAGWVDE